MPMRLAKSICDLTGTQLIEKILRADGKEIARGCIEHTLPIWVTHTDGFDVGTDTITPIGDDYRLDQATFTGTLSQLTVEVDPPH